MKKCYYLVYKLKTSCKLWLVNVMDNPYYFYDNFKKIRSLHEKYYIIMKFVNDIEKELKFKRFTIFNNDETCKIINETVII